MNEHQNQHQRQVELSVTIEERIYKHSYDTIDPAAVPDFVQQTKEMSENLEARRRQIWGEQVQEQPAVAVQAQPQLQPPIQAPPEETYKERKARKRTENETLKKGKKYSPNANLYTARLMQYKTANDPHSTGPEGLPDGMDEPTLEEAVKRVTEIVISPDMFAEDRFPVESVTLRRALYEYRSLDRIMAENPQFFENLKTSDPLRAKKLDHLKALVKPLEEMLRISTGTCGLTLEGEAIQEKNIVEHTRNVRAEALADFAQKLLNEDTAYSGEIEAYIAQRVVERTPVYDQRREDFRRQYVEDNPQSAWIDVPAFNYPPQYESLEKLRGLIETHGAVYLQNKALFDSMLEDITHSLETYALLKAQSSVLDDIQSDMLDDESKLDSKRAAASVTKKMDKLMKDSYEVIQRFENVNDAMKVLLRGGRLNGLNVAVLSQFGYNAEPQFKQRIIDDASSCGLRSRWQSSTLSRLLQDPRVHVGEKTSQFVQRAASMFRENDDDYNIALLNHLEQVKNLGENVPDKDFYDLTKQLLQPYVQKVLNWDIDGALGMNDDELADAQPQLDALFCDNMFVADLLKTKHWFDGTYTMKNEMLGDRIYEFGHRAAVLRALAEKSRGLALKRVARFADLPETAFSEIEWRNKVKSREGIPAFIEQRIDIGARLLETERNKYNDLEDVNSEAFKNKCKEQLGIGATFFFKGKFKEVEEEIAEAYRKFNNGEAVTEEELKLAHALYRLKDERYRLAGYTPEEAKNDGVRVDIGEPLFRSFSRFTESESGMQLTPQQFKQLVLDLGAGYNMKQGETPPQQLADAREQNLRGIARYKEGMRVQYDYLSKKYGKRIETLDIKYVSDHYMELLRDFANLQVDTSLMSRLPGFFEKDNPEDERLMHQAEYYCLLGANIVNYLVYYAQMGMDQGAINDMSRNLAQGDQLLHHRQYLQNHRDECSFSEFLNPQVTMQRQRGLD